MKQTYEINDQYQSLQKLDPQKTLANENSTHSPVWSIKRSTHQNKCMTNNMARQREQSQDKPARTPLDSTQHDRRNLQRIIEPSRHCGRQTRVNCMGSRRRDQGFNHHAGKLHGWQAQRPGIGTAFHGNVAFARAQHYTKWRFCLVSRFSAFHRLTFRYRLWWL